MPSTALTRAAAPRTCAAIRRAAARCRSCSRSARAVSPRARPRRRAPSTSRTMSPNGRLDLLPRTAGRCSSGTSVAAHRDLHPRLVRTLALRRQLARRSPLIGRAEEPSPRRAPVRRPAATGELEVVAQVADASPGRTPRRRRGNSTSRLSRCASTRQPPTAITCAPRRRAWTPWRAAAARRSFWSGFSRIVHVLKTSTSASSCSAASTIPRPSSMPVMRSLSCAFIWQPNVMTWYRFTGSQL